MSPTPLAEGRSYALARMEWGQVTTSASLFKLVHSLYMDLWAVKDMANYGLKTVCSGQKPGIIA